MKIKISSSMLKEEGKIKLLFVIDNLRCIGGAENQLALIIKYLDKDKFDIYVCNLHSEDDALIKEIEGYSAKVFTIPQKGFFDLSCLFRLNKLIHSIQPDIANTFLYTGEFYGRLAAVLKGVKIIVDSVRNIDLWKKKRNVLADRFLKRYTTHFIANSQAVKEYLIDKYHIQEDKITVIYNGVELDRFKINEPLAEDFGIDKNKKIVLNIARFYPQKDHATLVDVAKILLQKRRDVAFLLVGQGPAKQGIANEIRSCGLQDFFTFVEECRSPSSFYGVAYLCLLTSLYEGCSNFILESMAAGKPVVATSVGGNNELVDEAITGFLLPARDARQLADKVCYLLDNPEAAKRMGELARKKVEGKFSVQNLVNETTKVYTDLFYQISKQH